MQKKLRLTVDDLCVDTFVPGLEDANGGGTVHGRAITDNCTVNCTFTNDPRRCTEDTVCRPEVC